MGRVHYSALGGRGFLSGGYETVRPGQRYRWEGTSRGGQTDRPSWIFQYTLEGHGLFAFGRKQGRVPAGSAFVAEIPSAHVYQSDPLCPRWVFFWLIINVPYVTGRILSHPNLRNRIMAIEPGNPLILFAAVLLRQLSCHPPENAYDLEESLFRWMLGCERHAEGEHHPAAAKSRMLHQARQFALSDGNAFSGVHELARSLGYSRSNFSHLFRNTTGLTPAAYLRDVRLEEAGRLLRNTGLSVKEIAARTAFSSSNQFCKCFRRKFGTSAGSYRALYRS